MKDNTGFIYTYDGSFFIQSIDLSDRFKNHLKENSNVEVKIYMNLLGTLDDKLKWVMPSASVFTIDGYDNNYVSGTLNLNTSKYKSCYTKNIDGAMLVNTEKIVRIFKRGFISSVEYTLDMIPKDVKFSSPWLLSVKEQRYEKLKKLHINEK